MKKILLAALFFIANGNHLFAQAVDSSSTEKEWTLHADASAYIYPDDFFLVPIVWVKEHHLHFEARYNYEDFQTGSFLAGYNFEVGNKLHLDITPLAGFSIGSTNAFLPGVEAELMYWKVGLYVESEYIADLRENNNSYFSYWSELYYSPEEWIWFGLAAQRVQVAENQFDMQRGFMLALQKKWFTITGYYFNPFTQDYFFILNLGVTF